MKSFLLFAIALLLLTIRLSAQDLITTIKTTNYQPLDLKKYKPDQDSHLIKIVCADAGEATRLISKVKFTLDSDHPQDASKQIAPVKDETDSKTLIIVIPQAKLASSPKWLVALLVDGTVKISFKINADGDGGGGGSDEAIPVADLVTPAGDPNVKALSNINFGVAPKTQPVRYQDIYPSTDGHLMIYNIEKNELNLQLTEEELKKANDKSTPEKKKAAKLRAARNRRVDVGSSFSFELNPVPNPYKFSLNMSADYVNFNDSSKTELDKYLLNPFQNITDISAKSGGTAEKRKAFVLGYLQVINSAVLKFLGLYRDELQFIDRPTFEADKQNLQAKIDQVLSKEELHYPGNMADFVLNEFTTDDSARVSGVLRNYAEFQKFTVPQTFLPVGKVGNYDELGITVKATPKANQVTGLHLDTITNRVPITIFNGIKVDVSTGIFYSFLDQKNYSIRKDSTMGKSSKGADSVTARSAKIIDERGVNGRMGFASMVHFYSRWWTNVNVSLSFGVGLTLVDDPQLRYMGGTSLLLGRTNRIALSFGYMFGRVKELSDKYYSDDLKSFRPVNPTETELAMKKVTKGACFIAVSYNFPLLKRKK